MNTSPLSYSDQLKNPKWQRRRLEILNRDNFTCQLCRDTETELQIHHKKYTPGSLPWEYDNSELVTLCKHCHGYMFNNPVYPFSIVKKKYDDGTIALFAITERGLDFGGVVISHSALKDIVQHIMNYWLSEGFEYRLNP